MPAPLYRDHSAPPKKPDHAHAGLWFERFFNGYQNDWTIADTAKQTWIKSVTGQQGDKTKLENFVKRQHALVTALQGESHCYSTDWHFVTGMGNPHPVENGFSWHPTLAVPYLAGSAVKGLVRAWVELEKIEILTELKDGDNLSEENRVDLKRINDRLKHWFGTEDKEPVAEQAEQAGDFIFFDAIPSGPPVLLCDIMTPHMGKWYEQGDDVQKNLNPEVIPADWHEPIPLPFLAVKKAQLIFSIAPLNPHNKPDDVKELAQVFEALNNALLWLGAGAKTAAGYGYMTERETDKNFMANLKLEQAKQVEKERKNSEWQDKKNLSPEAQNYFKQSSKDDWEINKDKFLKGGVEDWLTKLESNPDSNILNELVRLLDKHIPGLLENPNKVQGKKAKPVYSERQKKIANKIKSLQENIS